MRGEILWSPPSDVLETTQIGAFMRWVGESRAVVVDDHESLWQWSVDDLDGFWMSVAEFCDTRWGTKPEHAVTNAAMPGTRWFEGGTLNYAEHALRWAMRRADETAVVAHSQTRPPMALSWGELAEAVARCRAGLVRLGVTHGDCVVAYA
ncbi:MAG: acetyl-coenzyme A synthetase N-terminal domain-containing protein, partial [Acidimicrobiia bacterium]